MKELKSYSDSYFYKQYPKYQKLLLDAIMTDPLIDKATEEFKGVILYLKHQRTDEALLRILNSTNTVLLDCDVPLPRTFKVFCAKEMKGRDRGKIKVFIDASACIVKDPKHGDYNVNETALVSYLMNAGVSMIYHKNFDILRRRANMNITITKCFANCFTHIIDFLVKISIQESKKIQVTYLSAMYFLMGILQLDNENKARDIAMKVADISKNEAILLEDAIEKACRKHSDIKEKDLNPYENIKIFVNSLRDAMHLNPKAVSLDIIVERWMMQFGPGTVFGLEYFPAFSAMITDAYVGGYLNNQKTIEKICGKDMVQYSKDVITMLGSIA